MNRTILNFLCTFLLLTTLLFSCTVERRLHRNGWHIETRNRWKQMRPEENPHKRLIFNVFCKDKELVGPQQMAVLPELVAQDTLPETDRAPEKPVQENNAVLRSVVSDDTIHLTPEEYRKYKRQKYRQEQYEREQYKREHYQRYDRWSKESKGKTLLFLGLGFLAVIGLLIALVLAPIATVDGIILLILAGFFLVIIGFILLAAFFLALAHPTQEKLDAREKARETEPEDVSEEGRQQLQSSKKAKDKQGNIAVVVLVILVMIGIFLGSL